MPAHFHFVLSLGAVIAIFSGIMFNAEKIAGQGLLPSPSSVLSLYHLLLTFVGISLTFSPMHFLGFNLMPRRIMGYGYLDGGFRIRVCILLSNWLRFVHLAIGF